MRHAQRAQERLNHCIDHHQSFRLEAGAGAGKTYSLVQALKRLISERGSDYLRRGQKVACITYTNVAKREISQEIDEHQAVLVETIHAFCWRCMGQFQSVLRTEVGKLQRYSDKIAEAGGIGNRRIEYDIGYFGVHDDRITLHQELEGTFPSMLSLTPQAINVSLFRPYVWEVQNPLMALSAVEGLILMFFTIYVVIRKRVNLIQALREPVVLFCMVFSLTFAFAVGVSTYNFGTLSRYKIPLMPFYLLALIFILYYENKEKKVEELESTE